MPGGEKTYKVGKDVFNIPEKETGSFLKDFPNATEIKSYVIGRDTFDIPVKEVPDFIRENKEAKELGQPKKEPAQAAQPFLSDVKASTAGSFDEVGTHQPKQSKSDNSLLAIVSGTNTGVPQSTVNKAGMQIGVKPGKQSKKPDIGEAIDNLIAKKTKNFPTSKEGIKVQKQAIEKAYKDGDLALALDRDGKSVLKKGTGFFESVKNAVQDNFIRQTESKFVQTLSPQEKIQYLNNKAAGPDTWGYSEGSPTGILGKAGEMIGGTADVLMKGAVGATALTVAAPAAVGSGSFGAFVGMAKDLANQGYMDALEKNYYQLKEQGVSDEEAMSKAEGLALVGSAVELGVGAAQGSAALKALKPTVPVKGVVDGIMKSGGQLIKDELPKVALSETVGRGGQGVIESAAGVDVKAKDVVENIGANILGELALPVGMWALTQPLKFPSYLRPQFENVVASADRKGVETAYKTMEMEGVIEKGTTEKVVAKLEQFDKAKAPLEKLPIPDENKAAIAGKILQKEKLQAELSNLTKHGEAFAPRIEELNNEIAQIEKDMSGMYKAEDVFTKEADTLTGETINETKTENDAISITGPEEMGVLEGWNETTRGEESSSGVGEGNPEELTAARIGQEEGRQVEGEVVQPVQKEVVSSKSNEDVNEGQNVQTKAQKNSTAPVKEFVSKQGHKIVNDGGEIKVISGKGKNVGKEVAPQTAKKVYREAAKGMDLTEGNEAPITDQPFNSIEESSRYIVETSNNPAEIADIFLGEERQPRGLSSKEFAIASYGIGDVLEDSFNNFGDKNFKSDNIARSYFKGKENGGRNLDDIAMEISQEDGIQVTPEDVKEYMIRFPQGTEQGLAKTETELSKLAKARFSELTGLPLTEEVAQIASRQRIEKSASNIPEDVAGIINNEGITADNLEKVKHLFNGFPYTEADYEAVRNHFEKTNGRTDSSSGKTRQDSEGGESGETEVREIISNGLPKDASKEIKQKVSDFFDALKLDTSGKQSYALPIPPQLWNAFVDVVKQATLSGIDLATAVKQGVDYLRTENISDPEIDATKDYFSNLLKVKQNTRNTAPQTGAQMELSKKKFTNALNPKEKVKETYLSRVKSFFSNLSFYIDNPNRYITKLQHSIEDYYNTKTGNLSLGRVFEQNARGRGLLKVREFVETVIKGLKKEHIEDFHQYVFARRIIDRHEQMLKDEAMPTNSPKALGNGQPKTNGARDTGNITMQDAINIVHDMETRLGKEVLLDFNRRSGEMQRIMNENLQLLVKSGVLAEEAYEAIIAQNDFYAPFNVVQDIARENDSVDRPAVASNIIKRIKGISFKEGEYKVKDIETLQDEYTSGNISKEEFYDTATTILSNLKQQGTITEAEYAEQMGELSNAGFGITNIFDKAANIIFDSQRIAHKNELMNRLLELKAIDTQKNFIRDVDAYEFRYDKDGNSTPVARRLDQIKTDEGFGVVGFRVKGKQQFLSIDKKAANTLNGMDRRELEPWMKALNAANSVFRVGVITISPAFQTANMIIDFFRTAAMNKYGLITGKNVGDGVANAVLFVPQYIEAILHAGAANLTGKKSKLYEEFMKSDAYSSGMFDDPFQGGKRKLNVNGKSTFDHIKYGGIDKLFKIVEGIGKTLEQSHKIVSLERGLDVEGVKRLGISKVKNLLGQKPTPSNSKQIGQGAATSNEVSTEVNRQISKWKTEITKAETPVEMAAAMDRIVYETQNFAGSPNFPATHSGMKALSVILQFFSARIKGEFTDYRRIMTMFGGNAEGIKMSKKERAQLIGQFAATTLIPIVTMALLNNADDEDEKSFMSMAPWDRDNNIPIPFGTFEHEGETIRDYIKIPVRGVNSSLNVTATSFVRYMKKKDPETMKQGVLKILSNSSPLSVSGDNSSEIMESVFPGNTTPLIKWYLELATNRNTFRHSELKPFYQNKKYNEGKIPVYEVYDKRRTPEWAKEMSKYLFESMQIEWTPISIDHFENSMMGNVSETLGKNAVGKRFLRSESKYPVYKER